LASIPSLREGHLRRARWKGEASPGLKLEGQGARR
jgi:hypothetical protein